jgi:histidine triad (HIT) family protein
MSATDCIFCKILDGKVKSYKVCENDFAIAILDVNPFSPGHCLIVPRRHVPWWYEMDEKEILGVFGLAKEVSQRIMKTFKPEFVSMYARGKRIPHAHIFVVPSNSDSPFDKFFNALAGFQESPAKLAEMRRPESMEEAARKLRDA